MNIQTVTLDIKKDVVRKDWDCFFGSASEDLSDDLVSDIWDDLITPLERRTYFCTNGIEDLFFNHEPKRLI